MKQKTFTAPSNQIIRVTGISILPNGSRHTVAYITEHLVTHQFTLYLADDSGYFQKSATSKTPDFPQFDQAITGGDALYKKPITK